MNWYFASGDLEFFWKETIRTFSWLPNVFRRDLGYGFDTILSLWLEYPFRLVLKLVSLTGTSWFIIEKLLWLSVILLAVYSSYTLTKHWLAPVIYVANTYFLLLFAGGQLGVAFAYAFAPLVLYTFTRKGVITNGLWLALLIVFDLRIAYLILFAIAVYIFVEKKYSFYKDFILSCLVAASVHLYWILPTVLASRGTASLGPQFTSAEMLKFLSFADLPHALSLLHPNWPENLFGKVYFFQPQFLVIPALAFAALLFLKPKTDNGPRITFFALLALIGAFFAKGVNDPFGGIFGWMFSHFPGFIMFRDPTKFYLYVAIGYSVLIPYLLQKINNKIVYVIFIVFWIFTLRGVTIKQTQLPEEYIHLKNLLVSDTVPSRTLWIPQKENFAYYSDVHPILTATYAAVIDSSVKYVIVPLDVNKRIFLNDYKYDPSIRVNIIGQLGTTLIRQPSFHDLAVFENPKFTGMTVNVPPQIARQQQLANTGVWISLGFLSFWLIWIFLH